MLLNNFNPQGDKIASKAKVTAFQSVLEAGEQPGREVERRDVRTCARSLGVCRSVPEQRRGLVRWRRGDLGLGRRLGEPELSCTGTLVGQVRGALSPGAACPQGPPVPCQWKFEAWSWRDPEVPGGWNLKLSKSVSS